MGTHSAASRWIAPVAIAAGVGLVLWIWTPWSETSLPGDSNAEPATAEKAKGEAFQLSPAAMVPSTQTGLPIPQAASAPGGALPAVGDAFWEQVDVALNDGAIINGVTVESWLMEEHDAAGSIEDRAKARLSELQMVGNALAEVAAPDGALTVIQVERLDKIFRLPPIDGAKKLNEYIQARYELRKDKVFATLATYVRTHRSPEVLRVFFEMLNIRPRPGPKTRTWIKDELPNAFGGS